MRINLSPFKTITFLIGLAILELHYFEHQATADFLDTNQHILNEIRNQGFLCEDGLKICDYFGRDHAVLLKRGPGSYFFREAHGKLYVLHLDEVGLLKLEEIDSWGRLENLNALLINERYNNLRHPIKTESFCGSKDKPLDPQIHSISSSLRDLYVGSKEINQELCPEIPPSSHSSTGTKQQPFYCEHDAVFHNDALNVKGRTVWAEDAEARTQAVLKSLKLNQKQLHRAQLFHGSTSASLTAFTDYNDKIGALVPLGILENEKKKIAFSGEIVYGRNQINAKSLSTTWAGELKNALRYAKSQNWNPEKGRIENEIANKEINSAIEEALPRMTRLDSKLRQRFVDASKSGQKSGDFTEFNKVSKELIDAADKLNDMDVWVPQFQAEINIREVNEKRLSEWKTLTPAEQELVSNSFPVLYGIRTNRKEDIDMVRSDIGGEMALKGGANPGEIRVVFVPKDKLLFVKNLLNENGHSSVAVEPLPKRKDSKTAPL